MGIDYCSCCIRHWTRDYSLASDLSLQYVPPELADVYREHLLPLADVVTPNQFEAEYSFPLLPRSFIDHFSLLHKHIAVCV